MGKRFYVTVLVTICSCFVIAQNNIPIPLKAETGLYEIVGNQYKLNKTLNYHTYYSKNDNLAPNLDDCLYVIEKDSNILFNIRVIVMADKININANDVFDHNLFYTNINLDDFVATGIKNNAAYYSENERSQIAMIYSSDMDGFFLVDVPVRLQGEIRIIHMKPKFM